MSPELHSETPKDRLHVDRTPPSVKVEPVPPVKSEKRSKRSKRSRRRS